jgi:hypothetical protein
MRIKEMATELLKIIVIGFVASPVFAQDGEVIQDSEGNKIEIVDSSDDESIEERTHFIQAGDTLWDVSQTFWGQADQWPRMWSYNRYITNPHWIYPGNQIRFTPGSYLNPPTMELDGGDTAPTTSVTSLNFEGSEPVCGPDVRFDQRRESAIYHTPAFLGQKGEVETYGSVYGAKSGMKNLGIGDTVYLEIEEGLSAECGDVYTVFRRRKGKVRHPHSWFKTYGYMHEIVAEVRVVQVGDGLTTGIIRRSYQEVQRGDEFGDYIPVSADLPVSIPNGELDAVILARMGSDASMLAGTGSTIFLDRGRADGLQVGDAFFVVHHSDDYRELHGYDELIPNQVAGRIIVTALDEYHATAVIVDSARPISIGDHLAMRVE